MAGEEEIVEVQALRSASAGGKPPASSSYPPAPFPRSRSSTTILLRSSSRVTPNGGIGATEIKEDTEKVMQADVEKSSGPGKNESAAPNVAMANSKGGIGPHSSYQTEHTDLGRIKQATVNDEGTYWDKMREASTCRRDVGMWRSTVVEFMATLVLTFTSVAAVIACLRADFSYPRIAVATTQFLIYTMCIVAAAPLSGGHLNPSFSFACIIVGHISPLRGLLYILAQSAGSVLGALSVRAAVPSDVAQMYYLGGCLLKQQVLDANLNTISSVGADYGPALVAELFFSFLLIAVALPLLILCPPSSRCPRPAYPGQSLPSSMSIQLPSLQQNFISFLDPALLQVAFIIGLLLGLLIFVSGQLLSPGYTSAGMNPARCFGPAVAEGGSDLWQPQWVFWLGPFLAALLFALLYVIVFYNHPSRRSYMTGRWLAPEDRNPETRLPLVGASENPLSNASKSGIDEPRETSDLRQEAALTESTPKRMDVFLHIKATMQNPDPSTSDEPDKSTRSLSTLSPLTAEASALVDEDRHVILEHANLSLRHLMELPSTSSKSPVLKLEGLLNDSKES